MEKKYKVKNVSRGQFDLNLGFVKEGKVVQMKPDSTFVLSEDEYNYLIEQCKGAFKNGFLEIVSAPENTEKVESENVLSDEDIDKIVHLTIGRFRNKIKTITSQKALGDIYKAARACNANDKYIEVLENQIKAVGDGSLVL